jgi:hypothetical protein
MATLSNLVSALDGCGVPQATVFAYGRFAREAGLIAQKGRGRGAATMTATDAANLLIAIGGTDVTREAASAINIYRPMKAAYYRDKKGMSFAPLAQWCEPLGLEHTNAPSESAGENLWIDGPRCVSKGDFGNLVEFLIMQAGLDNLMDWQASLPDWDTEDGVFPWFEFIFHRPVATVSVKLMNYRGCMLEIVFKHKGRLRDRPAVYSDKTINQQSLMRLGEALVGTSVGSGRKRGPKAGGGAGLARRRGKT